MLALEIDFLPDLLVVFVDFIKEYVIFAAGQVSILFGGLETHINFNLFFDNLVVNFT